MTAYEKTVTFGNRLLEFLYRFVFELRNHTASLADKMIVVFPHSNMFIPRLPVSEMYFMGNPGLGKKFQCAAHSGITDGGMPVPDLPVKFLNAHMPRRGEKKIKDYIPLPRGFKSPFGDEITKYPFFFRLQIPPPN
jgi:hypothetical protein